MTVTFYAIHLIRHPKSHLRRKVWAPVDGSPELNIANVNASKVLWSIFDVEPEEGLCGDIAVNDGIKKLAFWMRHGGPKTIITDDREEVTPNGGRVVHGGRSYEQVIRYAEKLHEILLFASMKSENGSKMVRLGWG